MLVRLLAAVGSGGAVDVVPDVPVPVSVVSDALSFGGSPAVNK
jgi:hypothetical protein